MEELDFDTDLTADNSNTADRTAVAKRAFIRNISKIAFKTVESNTDFKSLGYGSYIYQGADQALKTASLWETVEKEGQVYLQRTSDSKEDLERDSVTAVASMPAEFPTSQELEEWVEEQDGTCAYNEEDQTYDVTIGSEMASYEDLGGSLKRQAEDAPRLREIPEGIEFDVALKYEQQGRDRELSDSEQADLALVNQDLERKELEKPDVLAALDFEEDED